MKISVLTVCYNSAETIRETIESVKQQSRVEIEYIIVDGGSNDETLDIINEYQNLISLVISEPDNGIYDAMNKGISHCSGDIVAILNSDDSYYDENVLYDVSKAFEESATDIVFGDLVYVDRNNVEQVKRTWKTGAFVKGSFATGWHPPHPSFFVTRAVYETNNDFDLNYRYAADFVLMHNLLEVKSKSAKYLPRYCVRMREGGLTGASYKNIWKGNLEVICYLKLHTKKFSPILYIISRLTPKIFNKVAISLKFK